MPSSGTGFCWYSADQMRGCRLARMRFSASVGYRSSWRQKSLGRSSVSVPGSSIGSSVRMIGPGLPGSKSSRYSYWWLRAGYLMISKSSMPSGAPSLPIMAIACCSRPARSSSFHHVLWLTNPFAMKLAVPAIWRSKTSSSPAGSTDTTPSRTKSEIRRCGKCDGLRSKMSDGDVARMAEEPAHTSCSVVVVDTEFSAPTF